MGEIAGTTSSTMTKKKKKKGRPSLLDLQKRSLKQHQNPNFQNPNSDASPPLHHRRSTRRNPNLDDDDDDDEDERQKKKHKLLLGLNSHANNPHYPISPDDAANPEAALKKPKIGAARLGSDNMGEKATKATDTLHESSVEHGPTTPLPDKKLLVFILDRLQKKDTYGVYSEPVDPEELPDYHDIIEHPMDFSTVRKKLDGGDYADLEQFEKDVLLICSNAMQYNSPDTIYFRQARAIQELAKRDFENLRQESDEGEPQPKVVRRGRPPGKMKKPLPLEKSPFDRVGPECSSDATLASAGDNLNSSSGYNLRRTHSYKYQPADVLVRPSYGYHGSETYGTWISEWENEFPASVLKAVLKYGKKPFAVDENRRDTYIPPSASIHDEPSSLNIFGREPKQLMTVGLNSEHGYARSLARFAADLGPSVWKIAAKKIQMVLPTGVEFGPGWVGEDNKAVEGQQPLLVSETPKVLHNSVSNDHLSRVKSFSASQSGTNSPGTSQCSAWSRENMVESSQNKLGSLNSSMNGIKDPASLVQVQQKPTIPADVNAFSRLGRAAGNFSSDQISSPSQVFGNSTRSPMPGNAFGLNKMKLPEISGGLIQSGNPLLAQCSGPDSQTLLNSGMSGGKSSWQGGLPQYHQQEFFQLPPDLNVGFLSPASPSSSVPIGSPQQPDLALQL